MSSPDLKVVHEAAIAAAKNLFSTSRCREVFVVSDEAREFFNVVNPSVVIYMCHEIEYLRAQNEHLLNRLTRP